MLATSKRARQWNTLVLLTVGLAVAIFAWGLNYKLSLYEPATRTVHHTVAAKLLSDRERSADTLVQVASATAPILVILSTLFAFASYRINVTLRKQPIWLLLQTRDLRRDPGSRVMRRLFSRPPPITQ